VKYATKSGQSFTPPSASITEGQVTAALETAKAGRASPGQPSLRLELQQLPPECADCLTPLAPEAAQWCPICQAQLCYLCLVEHLKVGCDWVKRELKKQAKSIRAQEEREKGRRA